MALLCLANTPLPAPWVQWLEGEPERLPVRLQTPYVAGSGPAPNGEFVPPAAAVAAAASATGMAVSNELGGGSVPVGGAAALQQAGAVGAAAAAAAAGAARNASGSAGSTGLGAAAAAENITAKLENVRYPTITLSHSSSSRVHCIGRVHFLPYPHPYPTQVQWETVSAAQRRAAGGHAAEALRAKVSEAMRAKAMEASQEARAANAAALGSAPVVAAAAAAATAAAAAAATADADAAAACRLCEEGESPRGDAQAGRRDAVRRAMQHAWHGYEAFAWGQDELDTISQTGEASYRMALTMVGLLVANAVLVVAVVAQLAPPAAWDARLRACSAPRTPEEPGGAPQPLSSSAVACGAAISPCHGRSLCGAPPQVDSLDTLFILGLDDEFSRAATWLGENLRFGEQEGINLFEVTATPPPCYPHPCAS